MPPMSRKWKCAFMHAPGNVSRQIDEFLNRRRYAARWPAVAPGWDRRVVVQAQAGENSAKARWRLWRVQGEGGGFAGAAR